METQVTHSKMQASTGKGYNEHVFSVTKGYGLGLFTCDATWTEVSGTGGDPSSPKSGYAWKNQALLDFNSFAFPT